MTTMMFFEVVRVGQIRKYSTTQNVYNCQSTNMTAVILLTQMFLGSVLFFLVCCPWFDD